MAKHPRNHAIVVVVIVVRCVSSASLQDLRNMIEDVWFTLDWHTLGRAKSSAAKNQDCTHERRLLVGSRIVKPIKRMNNQD